MQGLALLYRSQSNGSVVKIELDRPQYIFMEPYDRVVIRYIVRKDGLEENSTKLTRQTVDPNLLIVKVKQSETTFLSKFTDFDSLSVEPLATFEVNFKDKEEATIDVLYENITERRLRVKVRIHIEDAISFENENSYTDGPDEYVRMSNVQIKYDAVYFDYMFRRSGRLKKYVGRASYSVLGQIYKDREFTPLHVDADLSRKSITEALADEGWGFNPTDREIFKTTNGRKIEMTDEELGNLIKTKAKPLDILELLKTNNAKESKHPLRREAELFLVNCDRACSLPEATVSTTIDERGI